jgi:serine/threonine protein kinase
VDPDRERRVLDAFDAAVSWPEELRDARLAALLADDPALVDAVRAMLAAERDADLLPTSPPEHGLFDLDAAPPERVGAYRLRELIGRGGMGDVYRGERIDGGFDQSVAIKLIRSGLLSGAAAEQFARERQILARLHHPHITQLYDGGFTPGGQSYIVMELIEGDSILDHARDGHLALKARLALFSDVCGAIAYAHTQGVVHADIKPSNIIIDPSHGVKLLDFGISGLLSDESVAPSQRAATAGFASPQQRAHEPAAPADDIFSLGVLLDQLTIDCPGRNSELGAIIAKARAPEVASRYEAAADLALDIDHWRNERPVKAVAPSLAYRGRKYLRRNWRAVTIAGVIAAAIGAAGIGYLNAEREHAEARFRFDDARGAARYLLYTLFDEVEVRPNSLGLRREIASVAQRYLTRLADSRSTFSEVRLEAAQGLLRLSQIEGSPLIANLGQPEASKRNLEAALRMVRPLAGIAARRTEAQAELDEAYLAEMVEENQQAAYQHVNAAKRLIDADPDCPWSIKATYYVVLSTIDRWNNHFTEAKVAAKQAVGLLSHDNQLSTLIMRGRAVELVADAIDNMDKHAEADAWYVQAMTIFEHATVRFPNSYYLHRRLAIAHYRVGIMDVRWGDAKRGLTYLEQAVREGQSSVAFQPDDDDAKRSLYVDELGRAQAMVKVGQADEGIRQMQDLTAQRKALWDSRPLELRRMRDYGLALDTLADLQVQGHQYVTACVSYANSRKIFEQIAKQGQISAADRDNTLGDIIQAQKKYCTTRNT